MDSTQLVSKLKVTMKPKLVLWIVLSIISGLIFISTFFFGSPGLATTVRFTELILLMLISLIVLRYYDLRIENTQPDSKQKKSRKLILNFWILLSMLLGLTFLSTDFFGYSGLQVSIVYLELICLILVSFIALKYFDLPVFCFLIVFFGLYFKRWHWPLAAELMTIGTLLLSIISLINSGRFLITFRNNMFLKWFGCLSGVIVTLFMTGMLYLNLYWSGNVRMILIFSGCFLFIIYVLALVFTLPNSNYIAWSGIERKVFFRAVLIPMVFIFALITLIVVFSHTYNSIMGRLGEGSFVLPYEYNPIKLFDLEGILPI